MSLERIPTLYFQSPLICNNIVADAGTCEKRPTPAILNLGIGVMYGKRYWGSQKLFKVMFCVECKMKHLKPCISF